MGYADVSTRQVKADRIFEKQLRKEGYYDEVSTWQSFSYNTRFYLALFGAETSLKLLRGRISRVKGSMGLVIFDPLADGDGRKAEVGPHVFPSRYCAIQYFCVIELGCRCWRGHAPASAHQQ